MRVATLPPRTQLALTIIVPLASLVLGALLVWPYVSHLRTMKKDLQVTKTSIDKKKLAIRQAEAAAQGRPLALAVANPTEGEPIAFLRQLAALAAESKVSLTSVRARGGTRPGGGGDNPYGVKPTEAPAPQGATPGQRPVVSQSVVRELRDQVTVEGQFGSVLALLVRLENFERILSVSDCKLRSGERRYPLLTATFTLSRFVAAPAAPAATAPPADAP